MLLRSVFRSMLLAASLLIAWVLAADHSRSENRPGDAAKGRSVFFNRCVHCHTPLSLADMTLDERSRYDDSIPADADEISWRGPSLSDLMGRKAGTEPGFEYSDAMRTAQVIWNEDTLRHFLLKPSTYIPGNKMRFNGIKREGEMEDLIAYLKGNAKGP